MDHACVRIVDMVNVQRPAAQPECSRIGQAFAKGRRERLGNGDLLTRRICAERDTADTVESRGKRPGIAVRRRVVVIDLAAERLTAHYLTAVGVESVPGESGLLVG